MGSTNQLVSRVFACPVELTLEVLGGKWKPVILAHLKEGPLRYAGLRELIPRLSDKVLSQRLRELEAQGLIARLKSGAGARSQYHLAELGRSLAPVLQALYEWGERMGPPLGAVIRPRARPGDLYRLEGGTMPFKRR